jgi:hypothetical protein
MERAAYKKKAAIPRRPARPTADPVTALLAAPVKAGLVEVGAAPVPTGVVLTGAGVVAAATVVLTKAGVEAGLKKIISVKARWDCHRNRTEYQVLQ